MRVQITLIGLGQIGISIGLALRDYKDTIERVGNDIKTENEREAHKKDAIDKEVHNLLEAVRTSRLIVLSLPLKQVQETLEIISHDLKAGTVILDTAPIKNETIQLFKNRLPEGCYHIGLVPALNPAHLHSTELGIASARGDLFNKSVFIVDVPVGVPENAVTLACDFVKLLGASPMLADPIESDGIMTSIHILPQLAGAALLNATVDQPGWLEGRKMAGRPYASVSSGLAYHDDIESLRMAVMKNRSNTVHALDILIAGLKGMRDEIEQGDETSVGERLEAALQGHKRWLKERYEADWHGPSTKPVDIPSFTERLFGTGLVKPKQL